jgi:hypothetical protein
MKDGEMLCIVKSHESYDYPNLGVGTIRDLCLPNEGCLYEYEIYVYPMRALDVIGY